MTPSPSARPAAPLRASSPRAVLVVSALLHAGLLALLLQGRPLPPDPAAPQLEMAFEAAPAPPAEPEPAAPPVSDMQAAPTSPVVPEARMPDPPPALAVPDEPAPAIAKAELPRPSVVKPPLMPKLTRRPVIAAARPPPSTSVAANTAPEAPAPAPPVPAAQAPAAPAPAAAASSTAWQGSVGSWLRSHKTYPDAARRNAEQGRVVVRFTVQHDGTVTAVTLLRSSGSAALDDAAQALLRGAHLPPFPTEMPQEQQTVSLGISYTLEP
jgi:protein TonB